MLDIDRGHDADAAVQQREDVLIPLLMPAPGDVRVREFIDHAELRPPLHNPVDVHLFEHDTPILDRSAGNDLDIAHLGNCVGTPISLDEADDDIAPLTPRVVRIAQHRIGLADTWRGANVEPQARLMRALHACQHLFSGWASLGLHHCMLRAGRDRVTALTVFLSSLERAVTSADPTLGAC